MKVVTKWGVSTTQFQLCLLHFAGPDIFFVSAAFQVRDCDGLALQVDPKVNSLILDSCKNMRVCVNSLIATVEIVNCHKVKLQVTGTVPAISIDKSQKIDIFVSEQSKGVEITTSKSSEMNMNYPVPGDEGDWVEVVIPEQYHHKLGADSKLETRVSNLYSC